MKNWNSSHWRFSKYSPEARPLEEVLQVIGELPDGDVTLRSPYLEIKILMTEPEPSYKYKIEEALKGKAVRLARIAAMLPQKKASGIAATSYEELQTIRPLDMALDVFKRKYGGTEMPDTMKQLLESVIKEAEYENSSDKREESSLIGRRICY